MDKIERSSSLHNIVSSINGIIDIVNENMGVLQTLNESSLGEKVRFTSTQSSFVTGEVYSVAVPGMYKIKTIGSGQANILIQRNGQDRFYKKIDLHSDDSTEEDILLTTADKILFYASSVSSYSVVLLLTKGLFTVTDELLSKITESTKLVGDLKNLVKTYTEQYAQIIETNNQLHQDVQELMTSVTNGMNELDSELGELR